MKPLLLLLTLACTSIVLAEKPNIVLVLADDLGYGDLACFGANDVQTPHLDRFASEGLRFTSCYAGHANCSPSRTALMTGRTPTRVGVRNWIPEDSPVHVRRSEITIAKLLQQSGYATCQSGKWHMNGEFNQPTQPQPGDHGFDHWFSTQNNAYPNHRNPDNFVRNGKEVGKLEGYAAHLVADEALRWLDGIVMRSLRTGRLHAWTLQNTAGERAPERPDQRRGLPVSVRGVRDETIPDGSASTQARARLSRVSRSSSTMRLKGK